MIVVTDASPLNYLVQLGEEDLLKALYHEVVCPETVMKECRHPHAPEGLRRWASQPPSWLRVVPDVEAGLEGLQRLDPGERAAIEVAKLMGAPLVLMDERKGRLAAASLGLKVVGVMGILAEAGIRKLVDFETVVDRLRRTTNFRVSQAVLNRARETIRQERSTSG